MAGESDDGSQGTSESLEDFLSDDEVLWNFDISVD